MKERKGYKSHLILLVSLMITVSILISFALNALLHRLFGPRWPFPPLVDVALISLLIALLVTALLSKFLFGPMKKLRRAMSQVADGDLSVRLDPTPAFRDVRELYAGFNMMVEELGSLKSLRSSLISSMSHEFKTPLSAIEGYATLLQEIEGLTPAQQGYVSRIVYNTRRLSTLSANILLLSRIENAAIPARQTTFDIAEQIRLSIAGSEHLWGPKELEFDVELADALYHGSELMHHVWDNLIGNAIKFSPQGGTIFLRLEHQDGLVIVRVWDQGPGIAPEALPHIFEKFYQADTSHRTEGNGLGLALVRQLLDLEGGTVTAAPAPTGGALFTVVLPAK